MLNKDVDKNLPSDLEIQIQHLLMLNIYGFSLAYKLPPIQIQHLLMLNTGGVPSFGALNGIQIQHLLMLNASSGATVSNGSEFKYNTC